MTYTYVVMKVSRATYDEIVSKLAAAGEYVIPDGTVDMRGIAIALEDEDQTTEDPEVKA